MTGLLLLVITALIMPLKSSTGTYVELNPVPLLISAMAGVWLLAMVRQHRVGVVPCRANRPLILFLLASLLSLLIGRATWDPFISTGGNFAGTAGAVGHRRLLGPGFLADRQSSHG